MVAFIDKHHEACGVEPICRELPIAPSTYYAHKVFAREPEKRSDRAKRDEQLRPKIRKVFENNHSVYGARKIWRQMHRKGLSVARCTVERLMREMGLQGAVRGRTFKTTVPGDNEDPPKDLLCRRFSASRPKQLWVAGITYVSTWLWLRFYLVRYRCLLQIHRRRACIEFA